MNEIKSLLSARQRLENFMSQMSHIPKKSLGQNFLVSDHVIDRILSEVQSFKPQALIEVGPGPGALTDLLLKFHCPLTLIEYDRAIAQYWREKQVELIEGDALQMDWTQLALLNNSVLVSNLPYQISSSLVIERSLQSPDVQGMVLMFQKEVAQRIQAQPATEQYGLLSVIAQSFWKVSLVCDAGPKDFSPAPRVASRVLSFRPLQSQLINRKKFLQFVKLAFSQRRKLLRKNLKPWLRPDQDDEFLIAKLEHFGLKPTARAEELSQSQFQELYEHLDHSR